ncbi:MAG: hypothetical protein AAF576_00235 [Pseudomonadota bacterium]
MLAFAARRGRWCLVAGLVAGFTLPQLAVALQPYLPLMIAALLFLAAFRIGPDAVWMGLRSDFGVVGMVLILQLAVPLALLLLAYLAGVLGTTAALAAILVFSAPSVTGSPNFALLMNLRPESALRLLMVGTALFPLTVLPTLFLVPGLEAESVLIAALRLLAVVSLAGGAAFALRRGRWKELEKAQEARLDGASAILLGIVVIGLMSSVGPLLLSDPAEFLLWLALAGGLNFSAQIIAWLVLTRTTPSPDHAATSIVAGNRNIALFLVALPPDIATALLSFIGCYQIPMYLTPILFRRIYSGKEQSFRS